MFLLLCLQLNFDWPPTINQGSFLHIRVSHFPHFSPNLYAPKICQSLWYKNDLPKFSEFSYPVFLSRFQFSLYIGFSRKIQRKSDHRIFFIFKILTGPFSQFNMLNLKNMRMSDFLCIFLENPMYNENWKRERKTG